MERGYLRKPTIVNNVETFCHAARIVELGADAMRRLGTPDSPGTKLISVSGDCAKPGIYDIEWGLKVEEMLALCEAKDPFYVQVSGPSGASAWMRPRSTAAATATGSRSNTIMRHRPPRGPSGRPAAWQARRAGWRPTG